MSDSPSVNPYREAPELPAQFVCTVCFETATVREAGRCDCHGVDRLPLSDPEVVGLLRERAEKILRRQNVWRTAGALVVALALALGICLGFGLSIEPTGDFLRRGRSSWFIGLALLFFIVLSGLAIKSARKLPSDAQGLLRWLRVKVIP